MFEGLENELLKLKKLRLELHERRQNQCGERGAMEAKNLINWIYGAMHLSGYSLSREDVSNIVYGDCLVEGTIDDYMTVQNYQELRLVFQNLLGLDMEVDAKTLKRFYSVLAQTDNTDFRRSNPVLREMRYNPPHSSDVGRMMEDLNRYLYALDVEEHPILKAVHLHCRIMQIYPFEEQNEGIAYSAMSYELLRQGYPLLSLNLSYDKYVEIMSDVFKIKSSAVMELYENVVKSLGEEMEALLSLSEG